MTIKDLIPHYKLSDIVLVTIKGSPDSVLLNLSDSTIQKKQLTEQYLKFIPFDETDSKDYAFILDTINRNFKQSDIDKVLTLFSNE